MNQPLIDAALLGYAEDFLAAYDNCRAHRIDLKEGLRLMQNIVISARTMSVFNTQIDSDDNRGRLRLALSLAILEQLQREIEFIFVAIAAIANGGRPS